MNEHSIDALETVRSKTQRSRIINRFADALILAYQIPEGDQLVTLLGYGTERSNREALCHWMLPLLQHPDYPMAVTTVTLLSQRLERVLGEGQEAAQCA